MVAHRQLMITLDWTNIIVGIVSSLVASLLFLYMLRLLPPNISISSEVAKTTLSDENVYSIKVKNEGRRDAINLRAELLLLVPQSVEGGEIYKVGKIPLQADSLFRLGKYSKQDRSLSYAFRFVTKSDLEREWLSNKKSFLRFVVFAQDSFSGFPKIFIKEFHSQYHDIIEGDFDRGLSDAITYRQH